MRCSFLCLFEHMKISRLTWQALGRIVFINASENLIGVSLRSVVSIRLWSQITTSMCWFVFPSSPPPPPPLPTSLHTLAHGQARTVFNAAAGATLHARLARRSADRQRNKRYSVCTVKLVQSPPRTSSLCCCSPRR
jgi:hypothetical protein